LVHVEVGMSLYGNNTARLDTIVGGDQSHLRQLISAREEFTRLHEFKVYIPWEKFYEWLIEEYGIRMTMSEGGMVNLEYEVVDETKYLIFTLKHSGK
jgi:hypothetical protein